MSWLDTIMGRDRIQRAAPSPSPSALQTPEEAAAFCLRHLLSLTRAETGHAYLLSPSLGQYRLAAAQGDSQPPPAIDPSEIPPEPATAPRLGERWLTVPCGTAMVLRARLRTGQTLPQDLPSRTEQLVQVATSLLETTKRLAEVLQQNEQLKTGLTASRMAADVALKPHRALELLFHFPLKLLGATDGGLALEGIDGEGPALAASAGRGAILTVRLLSGAVPELLRTPAGPDVVTGLALGMFRNEGVRSLVRVPVPGGAGCAYYFLFEDVEHVPLDSLVPVSAQLGQLIHDEGQTARTAGQYLSTLKSLVAATDNSTAYTTGHSARVARYAAMIAAELGLPPGQVEAIALGALLHDIGMTAIDTDAFLRLGKLTSAEYRAVQEHTRIGAELVGPVNAALPLSPMVAHHHERWDGRGYPGQLKGKDIPLGARIIAVADLFEAKTTGRAYRRPLPFQRAITDLQGQAGSQLDPDLVTAFVRAYQKVRQQAVPGRPIAYCWEVRQVPPEICGACPNRRTPVPVACWENPGERCSHHGEACATCIVYTEAVSRATAVPEPK